MKNINQDKKIHNNDSVVNLLAELNSTMDLYYEPDNENEIVTKEQ